LSGEKAVESEEVLLLVGGTLSQSVPPLSMKAVSGQAEATDGKRNSQAA